MIITCGSAAYIGTGSSGRARARYLPMVNERLDSSGHDPPILPAAAMGTKRLDQIGEVRIAIDHSQHFRHAHMRKKLFPKFIPASASWKKVRRKVRLTSIMLDSNSSVDSSPKRMMSASLSIPASVRLPGPYTCSRNEFLPAGSTGFPSTVTGNLRPCCGVRKCRHNGYNTRFQACWLSLVGRVVHYFYLNLDQI